MMLRCREPDILSVNSSDQSHVVTLKNKTHLNPKIHMFLPQVDFHPRERITGGVDKPVVEDYVPAAKSKATIGEEE
jgi:hypothetical protein